MLSSKVKVFLARALIKLILQSPEWLATIISIFSISVLYLALRKRRKIMFERLTRYNLGTILMKKIAYRFARNLVIMSRSRDVIINAAGNFAGKVGVSVHFGPWELLGNALSKAGYKFGVVVRQYEENAHIFLKEFRSKFGIRTFYSNQLLKIRKFLKTGGTIGMMVDGNELESQYPKAKRLAQLFKVQIEKGVLLPHKGRLYLQTGNIDFKKLITAYPEHYAWFYLSSN